MHAHSVPLSNLYKHIVIFKKSKEVSVGRFRSYGFKNGWVLLGRVVQGFLNCKSWVTVRVGNCNCKGCVTVGAA